MAPARGPRSSWRSQLALQNRPPLGFPIVPGERPACQGARKPRRKVTCLPSTGQNAQLDRGRRLDGDVPSAKRLPGRAVGLSLALPRQEGSYARIAWINMLRVGRRYRRTAKYEERGRDSWLLLKSEDDCWSAHRVVLWKGRSPLIVTFAPPDDVRTTTGTFD